MEEIQSDLRTADAEGLASDLDITRCKQPAPKEHPPMTTPESSPAAARPFAAAPNPSRYFPAHAMEEARQRIGRSIQRGEGPLLVIGAAGLGKSLLLDVIVEQYRGHLEAVNLVGGQLCTRRALLQMVLFQLGLPYRDMDENELRLSLLSHLQPQNAEARRIILLVDEADALPPRLLEELRALTNISEQGQQLVNLVLAGNSTLEEQFADPKLDLFSQRISARCYLTAFGREETFQYVCAQVATTGKNPQTLFTDDGLEAIFAATDGVPRLINQLGDQLLWMVAETGLTPLDGMVVQQAWSELQQLPDPWSTSQSESTGGVEVEVEFGELSFDDEELGSEQLNDEQLIESEQLHETHESAIEEDSYADDFDDDLPASIPIHGAPLKDVEVSSIDLVDEIELTGSEAIDVTEQLLAQLSVMDTATQASDVAHTEYEVIAKSVVETVKTTETIARNPFGEEFESEEMVLDQYSTFERLLLAEAPKVVNQSDSAFAQQLQQMEVVEVQQESSAPIIIESDGHSESKLTASSAEKSRESEPVGDILIIEEGEPAEAEVVQGPQFRQLFSSLESADNTSRFG